jgi:hypothetical protein
MVYQYVVTLRNDTAKYIDLISIFLAGSSALLFLREQLITNHKTISYLIGFLFIAVVIIWNIYMIRSKKREKVYYNRALFFAALVWANMPYFQWLVFVFAFLGLAEYHAKFPLEIGFSDQQVVFNSLFKRKFSWEAFNNVMLKDNLLTLDFKSNRLFQRETIDEEGDAEEEEFNVYCKQRLAGKP